MDNVIKLLSMELYDLIDNKLHTYKYKGYLVELEQIPEQHEKKIKVNIRTNETLLYTGIIKVYRSKSNLFLQLREIIQKITQNTYR